MIRKIAFASIIARIPYGPEGDPANPGNQTSPPPPPPPPVSPPPPPPAPGPVAFTPEQQAKVNTLVAEERRKITDANKKTVDELEGLKRNLNLTSEQKEALQKQIDDLTATYTTKEQQAQTEMQKLQKKYDTDLRAKDEAAQAWETRYKTQTKKIDLRAAAEKHNAVRPEQIEKMLWDLTEVAPKLDDAGKPTDVYESVVKWQGKNKEGEPVALKLSPMDAVKAMVDDPENYGNLFNNPANSGVGRQPVNGGGGNGNLPNIEGMSPQQWQQHRAKLRAEMGKSQG